MSSYFNFVTAYRYIYIPLTGLGSKTGYVSLQMWYPCTMEIQNNVKVVLQLAIHSQVHSHIRTRPSIHAGASLVQPDSSMQCRGLVCFTHSSQLATREAAIIVAEPIKLQYSISLNFWYMISFYTMASPYSSPNGNSIILAEILIMLTG